VLRNGCSDLLRVTCPLSFGGPFHLPILLTDLQEQTKPDGSDLGSFLTQLFETLNTPKEKRQTGLPDHFKRYEYINGKLFEEPIPRAR
jgi:restriction-modification enzyme MmeI-like protein